MPLYMDLHHIDPDLTQEDLDSAHLKDIEVQDKYGLEHKKYYVNFEAKTVFCLISAPDKQALNDAHAEVHGVGPCNVIEVTSLTPTYDFHAMIGEEGGKNEFDVALTSTGDIDTGFRTLLQVSLVATQPSHQLMEQDLFRLIRKHDGRIVQMPEDRIVASFLHVHEGLLCLRSLERYLFAQAAEPEYHLALVTGRPVDETGQVLFEKANEQLQAICQLGVRGLGYIDEVSHALFVKGMDKPPVFETGRYRVLTGPELEFFVRLRELLNTNLVNPGFKASQVGEALGLSRSQLYRKFKEMTGYSPGAYLQEIRLRRALQKLKDPGRQIAQIAYGLGFNSPNYFTRLFKRRYGILPTDFTHRLDSKAT
ncbi:nickel-binding protein [Robiginitalea sp. SC105]|uniref:nickel-binding protein n=1 Tax=Robiginitalea sp. SC105 TaxID=2762332 RepID=UPI00163B5920|nr:nickel-binding protein [Robiginitalea sp. SC105]MBC2838771.1 DUF4242 domain-containing protein [Robiginitalea sp. SC105]